MKKKNISIIVNLFVGIMSFASWIYMNFFSRNLDALTSTGVESLKFFTVLSNLFNGIVAFIYAYWLLKDKKITPKKRTLKLVGTSAVGLTFVTVMVFLGPIYGYPMMFRGGNMWMHLILPLLSFISFIFLESGKIPFKYTLFSIVPTVIYSIGYLSNVIVNGIGEWPNRNDFYSFLVWGNKIGAVITVIILLVTWLISLALCKANKLVNNKNKA